MRRSSSTVYAGLFVLALGLYASRLTSPGSEKAPVETPLQTMKAPQGSSFPLQALYRRLQEGDVFRQRIDGFRIARTDHRIVLSFEGDELYSGDSVSVTEAWMPVIESVMRELIPELSPAFEVRVEGFKEESDESQGKSVFTQLGDYRLATDRASWFVDYLERTYPESKRLGIRLGAGIAATAKRIEISIELK